jgi:hypothetical protein
MSGDSNPSPEIKQLIEKLNPRKDCPTSQGKYEAILKRKSYDHHCFLECVLLRLDASRGADTVYTVQSKAVEDFTEMLTHVR